jgi:hypothetical protein
MRDWHLTADSPLSMRFAADVRLSRTDYTDDQSWDVIFGTADEPALAFQTRYGGRVGVARLVPMFVVDGKPVYEANRFVGAPVLRSFAPNYAKIMAQPLASLDLTAELWVMSSRAVGGRFTLTNTGSSPITLQVELFAQIVREGKMINMNLLGLDDGGEALHLGVVGNLNPIVMLEHSTTATMPRGEHVSPKLTAPVTIAAGESTSLRWIHSGHASLNSSLQSAYKWLNQIKWDDSIKKIEALSASTPNIETGDAELDTLLAFSAQVLLRSFIAPNPAANNLNALPFPSLISAHISSRGYSPRGDGTDHGWQWNGQTAYLAFLALPSVASIAPDLAKGVIKNAVETAKEDGWIDFKPGLAGQRANLLSAPLWGVTALRVYQATEDKAFLAEVFPMLLKFFERWFQKDVNADGDALPEWATTTQSGFPNNPLFARNQRWGQAGDISRVESPDLAAYLINEGNALLKLAEILEQPDQTTPIQSRLDAIKSELPTLFDASTGSYTYRDRDTHLLPTSSSLHKGKGDEPFDTKTPLTPPNRLILTVIGGKDHTPKVTVTIEGIDANGKPTAETVNQSAFIWTYGTGSAVSDKAYSQINYIKFEGLSRVYSVEVSTLSLTGQNLTQLLPLWTAAIDKGTAYKLIQTITDSARYWREYGLPVTPANDPKFAANNDGGSGGVWLLWNVMMIEALLMHSPERAKELFDKIIKAQLKTLHKNLAFREAYNSENGDGIGDLDELAGIMPLHLYFTMIGLRVINSRRVWAGDTFLFDQPVKVTQHGIEITRRADGTTVKFPTGHEVTVDNTWQLIEDPTPPAAPEASLTVINNDSQEEIIPIAPPGTESIIPVEAKKDDTLEIPISQIDFSQSGSANELNPATGTPTVTSPDPDEHEDSGQTTFKIPVKGPESDQ